ncbi:TetR/AcrR family transcriptional regulator [Streptomyces hokutonensis]|uniref:TetR/AcrR family transcriptional regulator n=1 Tax=Streptomyces hokutonensis TaxID=1306990 RepID=UPI00368296D5
MAGGVGRQADGAGDTPFRDPDNPFPSDAPAAQPVRSDVERNRGRILAAARAVFGRDGLGASMASVARETGVGIAIVFRHFPTREALVAIVFSDRMDAYADAVVTALEDPDSWHGFTGYV